MISATLDVGNDNMEGAPKHPTRVRGPHGSCSSGDRAAMADEFQSPPYAEEGLSMIHVVCILEKAVCSMSISACSQWW
jgi:hypothetical protein